MEADDLITVNRLEEDHQNGVYAPPPMSGNEDIISEKVNGSTENVVRVNESGTGGHSSTVKSKGLILTKETAAKNDDLATRSKLKGQGSNKSRNPPSIKQGEPNLVKKCKDGKDAYPGLTVSTGLIASNSLLTKPLKIKTLNETRPSSTKPSGKHREASTSTDFIQPGGLVEKVRVRPLKKGPEIKVEEDTQSSSPMAGDTKTLRMGTLPAYNFSFKCGERAEKRREFYSNLEKKIHAKEEEKTTLQAKSQESQEAEIKMLRKSLNFKATPMPSFYQEPAPPKVELKKTPTTRPKSPKLGRKKSSQVADSDENNTRVSRPGRLSLDENNSHNSPKGVAPLHPKKPLRKSLPKLPSQNSTLPDSRNEAPPRAPPTPEHTESRTEPDDMPVMEEHAQLPMFDPDQVQSNEVQEPIG